jgi:hypothetical protein
VTTRDVAPVTPPPSPSPSPVRSVEIPSGDPGRSAATGRLDRITDWLYRRRGETAAPLALALVLLARPTAERLAVGLPIVALGEALRLWAASHIGDHARGRRFRAPGPATRARGGPYRVLKHPLYAGNLVVCLGLLVAGRAGEPWFPALFLAAFCVQYSLFMRRETALMAAAEASGGSGPPTPARLLPVFSHRGLALEWPTLRTVLVLSLILVGLHWWRTGP